MPELNPYQPPAAVALAPEAAASALQIYTPWQIFFGALLGGPLSALTLIALNRRALGLSRSIIPMVGVGVAAMVVLVMLTLFLPDSIPLSVIPIATSLAFRGYAKAEQARNYGVPDLDLKSAHPGSWYVIIALSVASAAALFVTAMVLFSLTSFGGGMIG